MGHIFQGTYSCIVQVNIKNLESYHWKKEFLNKQYSCTMSFLSVHSSNHPFKNPKKGEMIHSVQPPFLLGGGGGLNLQPNFQKGGGFDRTSTFGGGCWERGG